MKLCHESDGAARFSNARATTKSSDELWDCGGGSMHIDGCATNSAATPQIIKAIFITSQFVPPTWFGLEADVS